MKNPILSLSLLVILTGVCFPVWAEKSDRNKPMNIEADLLRYDDLKQISIFSGAVTLTKGSIQIRGARLEVRQDPEGYQFGIVTGSAETPAFFRQKREGVDEFIEGEGEVIEYDGRADTVKFVRHGQLRRYRGALVADEISGGLIVYNNVTELFTVNGSAGRVAGAVPGGRVRAMLTPKPDPVTDKPAPSASGPALRSATTLEGPR